MQTTREIHALLSVSVQYIPFFFTVECWILYCHSTVLWQLSETACYCITQQMVWVLPADKLSIAAPIHSQRLQHYKQDCDGNDKVTSFVLYYKGTVVLCVSSESSLTSNDINIEYSNKNHPKYYIIYVLLFISQAGIFYTAQ